MAKQYRCTREDLARLAGYCSLMGLPGAKSARASLYYRSGFPHTAALAGQRAKTVQAQIQTTLQEQQLPAALLF